jgi:hypothetical protein
MALAIGPFGFEVTLTNQSSVLKLAQMADGALRLAI